ncbi:FkbM family methyltransferase [Helicobacter sp.]|uniref:FkbM family methyltransferase n=1 Tax=Helicobacter sp. TaxID=218 RepID=UPI0019CADC86|nr:FkbM family methyltransferase [Helicobacter sp.]MBD5165593.1 FkbM family methyltransferase [Helicobacter sp.]
MKYPTLKSLKDYPQALEIQNQLGYRLGEEFLNACKFWWCGGLLYFVLRIPKLKAEARVKWELKQANATVITNLQNQIQRITNVQNLIKSALCDSNGIGYLDLCLQNAYVPRKYYFIFYQLLHKTQESKMPLICVDGGAHKGVITDIILQCGGISYAFEPNIYLAAFLQKKYQKNPNVVLYPNAISDKNYTAQFLEYGLLSNGNRLEHCGDGKRGYAVEVLDLTEILWEILKSNQRIYLVKLDVEGAEFEILDKIIEQGLWKRIDYIVCEAHERFFIDGVEKMQNLNDKIKENKIENILLDWM